MTLTEMYDAVGFDFAIADQPEEMPGGVEVITPFPAAIENIKPGLIRDPDKPFLRLFTGGSTGKPKVWSKSPLNLFAEAFYLQEKFALSDKDLFVATVPPYLFMGSFFLFWFHLFLMRGYYRIFIPSRRKLFPRSINIEPLYWSACPFITAP